MPAEPKEPRTEAGKALIRDRDWSRRREWYIAGILAIEDQAATEARRELLAALPDDGREGLDEPNARSPRARSDPDPGRANGG